MGHGAAFTYHTEKLCCYVFFQNFYMSFFPCKQAEEIKMQKCCGRHQRNKNKMKIDCILLLVTLFVRAAWTAVIKLVKGPEGITLPGTAGLGHRALHNFSILNHQFDHTKKSLLVKTDWQNYLKKVQLLHCVCGEVLAAGTCLRRGTTHQVPHGSRWFHGSPAAGHCTAPWLRLGGKIKHSGKSEKPQLVKSEGKKKMWKRALQALRWENRRKGKRCLRCQRRGPTAACEREGSHLSWGVFPEFMS